MEVFKSYRITKPVGVEYIFELLKTRIWSLETYKYNANHKTQFRLLASDPTKIKSVRKIR